ncbi:MAG: porphobilinogen synthase [Proteobacteria bacterium]|nr:porphobilinogen synthase [Pseudomonadota bacterium]
MYNLGSFPRLRLRRNRLQDWSRRMVAENHLTVNDLVLPVFVQEGKNTATPIASMPGISRMTIDLLVKHVRKAEDLGIPAVAVFPVVDGKKKSLDAKEALNPDNLVCRAVSELKAKVKNIGLICDVALDPYTSHGHDGLVKGDQILNDETVEMLAKQAVLQARAGFDVVAPSDMMDGRIGAVRDALDDKGLTNIRIMSYAAKYASSFYGPFRDAIGSRTNLGGANKRSYQMDPSNSDEALREVAQDIQEGADMVMVKPGMPYLDIVRRIKERFPVPVFAYQVSGEYAMIKAATDMGWFDSDTAMMESLIAFKRAGATGIFTYAAIEVATALGSRRK